MKRILLMLGLIMLLASCRSSVEPEETVIFPSESFYTCQSRNLNNACLAGLSSTSKTCYYWNEEGLRKGLRCTEGWKPYTTVNCLEGDYFCYENQDYCRLKGNLDNPKVPRKEICNINN